MQFIDATATAAVLFIVGFKCSDVVEGLIGQVAVAIKVLALASMVASLTMHQLSQPNPQTLSDQALAYTSTSQT